MRVLNWDEEFGTVLSEDTIRAVFIPPEAHRISTFTYPPSTSVPGRTSSGTMIVMGGRCKLEFGDVEAILEAGQFVQNPAGEYGLTVLGQEELTIIAVWELPPKFQAKDAS